MQRLIKTVQERLDDFKPNTAVSAFMEWLNEALAQHMHLSPQSAEALIVMISSLIPFMASELLEKLFDKNLWDTQWPTYDPQLAARDQVTIAIQVNGKLRGTLITAPHTSQQEIEPKAREVVVTWLEGKNILKTIFVADRLINFVVS